MSNDPEKGETNPLLNAQSLRKDYSQDSLSRNFIPSRQNSTIGTVSGWGATPEVRKGWALQKSNARDQDINTLPLAAPLSLEIRMDREPDADSSVNNIQRVAFAFLSKLPGFLIAIILNLFLSMSFGAAFFPQHWQDNFPEAIPRSALGVQMFLFSTLVCQVTMTALSDFPSAMG